MNRAPRVVPLYGGRPVADYSGTRHFRLMFTHPGKRIGKRQYWHALCDCGTFIQTRTDSKVKSCGCLQSENMYQLGKACFKDKTDQRNGLLTYTKLIGHDGKRYIWQARCDCGTIKNVTHPNSKSCGCTRAKSNARTAIAKRLTPEKRAVRDAAKRISKMYRYALKKINFEKKSRTFEALGYKPEELVMHIEKQFIKGMSWDNMHKWHIDHIVPISTAKTQEEVIALNQLSNLRPLWSKDNMKKNDSIEFLL